VKARIALVGELDSDLPAMTSIEPALRYSADYLGHEVECRWISSSDVGGIDLSEFGGVWFAAGGRYVDFHETMQLIELVRTNAIPSLGTCRGFQYMVLEFARNILGDLNAGHEEDDPCGENLFLTALPPSSRKSKRQVEIDLAAPIAPAYPRPKSFELFFGRFGVNPKVEERLSDRGFVSMASEYGGRYRIAGLPTHPFYIGTLFVPQMRATKDYPHPIINVFLKHALTRERDRVRR